MAIRRYNDCTARDHMINTANLPSTFNVKPASCLMCQILFADTERDNQGREAEG